MFKLVLVLSLCYIAAECRQIKRSGGCDQLEACTSPMTDDFIQKLYDETAYKKFCQNVKAFSSCYATAKDKCDNDKFKNKQKRDVDQTFFLCSKKNKEDLFVFADSECAKNKSLDDMAKIASKTCMRNYINNDVRKSDSRKTKCLFLNKLKMCILSKNVQYCGKRDGVFVSRWWEAETASSFKSLNCAVSIEMINRELSAPAEIQR